MFAGIRPVRASSKLVVAIVLGLDRARGDWHVGRANAPAPWTCRHLPGYGGRLETFVARDQAFELCQPKNIFLIEGVEAHAVPCNVAIELPGCHNGAGSPSAI